MWKMTLQLGFTSIDELCYICVGGGSIGNDEEGNGPDLEQVPSFTKAYGDYESVESLFCLQKSSECDEQNIFEFGIGTISSWI
jgi:hypothetical protein